MKLINTTTLKVEEFVGPALESLEYAILSHTWTDEEVSFQEFTSDHPPVHKIGYQKIAKSCELARSAKPEQFRYIWVDTCCIDKSSSAELSESINSMFEWYRKSAVCYVYLADVTAVDWSLAEDRKRSRWFSRGWTLQELIAPGHVLFCNTDWVLLGTRTELAEDLSRNTSIDFRLLHMLGLGHWLRIKSSLGHVSVARRMSWAAGRQTTRLEDVAYCLMGLFGVHMPLLYGEGSRAFLRLQEETIKLRHDQSILAWKSPYVRPLGTEFESLFAPSPDYFEKTADVSLPKPRLPMSLSTAGLSLDVRLCPVGDGNPGRQAMRLAILEGHLQDNYLCRPGILVESVPGIEGLFNRIWQDYLFPITGQPTVELEIGRWIQSRKLKLDIDYDGSVEQRITLMTHHRGLSERARHSPPLMLRIQPDQNTGAPCMEAVVGFPPLTSPTSVIGYVRIRFLKVPDSDVRARICGILYLKELSTHVERRGVLAFWGVREAAQPGEDASSVSPWDAASPVVLLGESIIDQELGGHRGRDRKEQRLQQFADRWVRAGGKHKFISKASDSFSLPLSRPPGNPDAPNVTIHARIKSRSFLERTVFELEFSSTTE
ncbi:heterokaryon incompatibility protein-domain-containing protein [Lasiosphaeria ovina]|uniref:Heterokaryon incompatibility protein-domain-containing protein n=1 Tax=Lasiosphaeria ovina TaxID=92902 RepID=A0AAE0K3N9_9PEZI|nr:heterokaryon incompatibility protein-domain-containing protein [Lasiosphaeria ovina]